MTKVGSKVIRRIAIQTRNHAGFGLVEVMIAVAIISIIALGIGTLVDDMMKAQKKTNTTAVINTLRERIMTNIQNGESWSRTASDATANPNMTCMRASPSACDATTDYALNLQDASGNAIYSARVTNHGFDLNGALCTTYPTAPCIFRYDLVWRATCPGAVSSCLSPTVRVRGTLNYTPGNFVMPGGFNPAVYQIDIQRGTSATRSDAVMVSFVDNTANGEGPCTSATWTTRRLNRWSSDPGDNLLNKGASPNLATANQVRLRAGTYNCRVQSPAFKNGTNRLQIRSTAGTSFTHTSSSAVAALNGGSAVLLIEATLILHADSTFVVEQRCSSNPSAGTGAPGSLNDNWSLGVPVPDAGGGYGAVTYTTVSCTRTS